MKKKLIIIIVLVLNMMISAIKIKNITEITKPQNFAVDDKFVYVVQDAEIYIFSRKDGSYIRKFGRKGEGPGEMQLMPFLGNTIKPYKKYIFVHSFVKTLFFNKNSSFLKEYKSPPKIHYILPIGEKFAGKSQSNLTGDGKMYSSLGLYDSQFKKPQIICQHKINSGQGVWMASDNLQFDVYNNCLYVERSDLGFVIEVYNSTGTLIQTIKKNISPLKIKEKDRIRLLNDLKNDFIVNLTIKGMGGWGEYQKKTKIHWPEIFPAIRDICVTSNRIYLQTYKTKNMKNEFKIMDIDGNNMEKVFLPKVEDPALIWRLQGRETRFWDIIDNVFYYLKENHEEETWTLYKENIKVALKSERN